MDVPFIIYLDVSSITLKVTYTHIPFITIIGHTLLALPDTLCEHTQFVVYDGLARRRLALLFCRLENLPQPYRLVGRSAGHVLTIRRHGEGENPLGVTGQVGLACHSWVLPYGELVLDVTMARDQLAVLLRP